jgi:hypothetical protein
MDVSHLEGTAWWVYLIGYAYALGGGAVICRLIVDLTYDIVEPKRGKGMNWQPLYTGLLERSLYVSSLLMGKGELIGLWLVLKLAVQYKRWTGEATSALTERDQALKGRYLFANSLNGNGLSILCSFVGFLLIKWLDRGMWDRLWITLLLSILLTTFLYIYLDYWKNKQTS